MQLKRSLALAAALTVAGALALTGCSASDSSTAAKTTLNLAINAPPASLDFTELDAGTDPILNTSIYDRLIVMDPNGGLHPGAAESWSYNADKTVLTMKLRSGMKFSNGNAVNAAAVKATIDRQIAFPSNRNSNQFLQITSVAAPNATTAVFTLARPNPDLLTNLARTAGVIGDPSNFTAKDIKSNPIGSGAYVLDTSRTVNGSKYVLKKNTEYWDAKSFKFSTVNVTVISDATANFNALKAGQLDVALLTSDQIPQAKGAGFAIAEFPTAEWGGLVIGDRDGKKIPALGDVRVRQAINMVFDRDAIVKGLNSGTGVATNQMFQPGSEGDVKSLANEYPYDVKAAKKLMADAGYASGFSVTMPSVAGYTTTYEPIVKQSLAAIGITVQFTTVPFTQIVGQIADGTYPLYYWPLGWGSMAANLNSSVRPNAFFNGLQNETPELNGYLTDVDNAKSASELNAAYQKVGTYMTKQAWYAPLFTIPFTYGYNSKVLTYEPNQIYLGDNIRSFIGK